MLYTHIQNPGNGQYLLTKQTEENYVKSGHDYRTRQSVKYRLKKKGRSWINTKRSEFDKSGENYWLKLDNGSSVDASELRNAY